YLQQQTVDAVTELVAHAFALGHDLSQLFERFQKERVHERTLGITSTTGCLRRAIGNMPVTLDGWSNESHWRLPIRKQPWKVDVNTITTPASADDDLADDHDREPPKLEQLRHTEIRSASLIQRERWRGAGWWGFLYLNDPDHTYP